MTPLLGIIVFILIAWLLSEGQKKVSWTFVFKALGLQIFLAASLLKVPVFAIWFSKLNQAVFFLQEATSNATIFLFGYLAGGPAPFQIHQAENNFIIAVRVFPLILVVSALSALLFHWRILPTIIRGIGFVLRKTLGISGELGVGGAATVFLGTIEAPLFVRPYLEKLNRSDLFALISCSMATISGTVVVLYSSVLEKVVPNALSHLLIASIISVPAALLVAKVMIPHENKQSKLSEITLQSPYTGTMDALLRGINEGVSMVLGILGVILVFFALIYLFNKGLAAIYPGLSFEGILGILLRPIMWLTGIPWNETLTAGKLMGLKIVLNEFVAFLELAKIQNSLSGEGRLILTYALCGFANFASAGIIVGGLSTIMPQRRKEISTLTFKSLISGNLATLMTASIVALFI